MKKYALIATLLPLVVILYTFREQNLGDVLNINQVERIIIITDDNKQINGDEMPKIDQEMLDRLADYLNQYQVRATMKKGWISDYPSEKFKFYLAYKNGKNEVYTFERDVVASTRIYKIVNAPLDYIWIQDFDRELNSK